MEAGSTRKDVIKRFWNIGFEHSAIALHLVRTPEGLRDDAICRKVADGRKVTTSHEPGSTP
jgi:hypothetical protein